MTLTDKALKKFIIQYFIIICLVSLLHIITNWLLNLSSIAYSFIVIIIFHLLLFITVYRLSFSNIKPFIFIYLIIISIALYFLISSYWKSLSIVFIWLLVIPLSVNYIYNSKRILLYWSLFVLFIGLTAIFTPDKYLITNTAQIKNNLQIKFWGNFINILTFIILLIFFIYSENKIEESRNIDLITKDNDNIRKISPDYYAGLYSKIEEYFKAYKPWKNPDFKLTDLAIAVNSNTTYVSYSINYYSKMNFNYFVNKYRIEYAKELLADKDNYNKISDIFLKAGFKQQTTFNKAFKHFEKITPSEYIIEKSL